ncbi:MAG: hypothetical protein ACK5HU_02910 [Flavobacteriales bacterium]
MKNLKLLVVGLFLSFIGLSSAQENISATESIVNSQKSEIKDVQKVADSTTLNFQQESINKTANLDVKNLLGLSEEQQKQYTETEKQYIALRSQLTSKGKERALIESQMDMLEKRQLSNILNDQQLDKFTKFWNLKEKNKRQAIKEVEEIFAQEKRIEAPIKNN